MTYKEGKKIVLNKQENIINHKELPIGSVAYFVDKYRGRNAAGNVRWYVDFGIVEEHYPSSICLIKLEPADRRTINGVRYSDFTTPTRWAKLPKGWSYDTKLFEEGIDETVPDGRSVDLKDPQAILDAYENGTLVRTQDFDHSHIVVQHGDGSQDSIKGTYRLIRDHKVYSCIPAYESIAWREVYRTYAEAETVVQAHEAEVKRVAALSDYDWAVEQIWGTINRWAHFSPEERDVKKQCYFAWLMEQGNPEEIETRIFGDAIQWKKWKKGHWMNIAL